MAGRWQEPNDRYNTRRKRRENQPFRSPPVGGRQGCWGRSGDPFPGIVHPSNCQRKLHQIKMP